jgi:hypothetical protein
VVAHRHGRRERWIADHDHPGTHPGGRGPAPQVATVDLQHLAVTGPTRAGEPRDRGIHVGQGGRVTPLQTQVEGTSVTRERGFGSSDGS